MKTQLRIKTCPTCGSGKIKKVRKDWKGEYQGKKYSVPSLSFYECPDCGERVYDREAMNRIEEKSPALGKPYRKKAAEHDLSLAVRYSYQLDDKVIRIVSVRRANKKEATVYWR